MQSITNNISEEKSCLKNSYQRYFIKKQRRDAALDYAIKATSEALAMVKEQETKQKGREIALKKLGKEELIDNENREPIKVLVELNQPALKYLTQKHLEVLEQETNKMLTKGQYDVYMHVNNSSNEYCLSVSIREKTSTSHDPILVKTLSI